MHAHWHMHKRRVFSEEDKGFVQSRPLFGHNIQTLLKIIKKVVLLCQHDLLRTNYNLMKFSISLPRVSAASPRRILFGARGCVKSISPPAAAKHSLDGDIFFMILRSKIIKKMSPSKDNLARSDKKRLFTQPHTKDYFSGQLSAK